MLVHASSRSLLLVDCSSLTFTCMIQYAVYIHVGEGTALDPGMDLRCWRGVQANAHALLTGKYDISEKHKRSRS